ncbi:MAG: AAA family ATPase [Oscillospiraceae bacterium]|nr:AAA family ATPase [Oscillospiraceae bacterium]
MADETLNRCKDAEIAIIGSILISPECIGAVISTVAENDFLTPQCKNTFAKIRELFSSGKPVDAVLVNNALGGEYAEWLLQCIEVTPTAANVMQYCEILKTASRLVKIRDLGLQLISAESLDEGEKLSSELSSILVSQSNIQHVSAGDLCQDFYKRMSDETKPTYIKTGFPILDEKLFIERGDVVGIGAAPSTGKTAFALQWAALQAQKHRVGFYSLETSPRKIADRLLARESEISLSDIKRRTLPDDAWIKIGDAASRVSSMHLEVIPAQGMTAADIMADAAGRRYEMIFVDYLQIVAGSRRNSDRYDIVTDSSMTFHLAAQRHGITVVLLSQLSRPEKSKTGKFVPPDMHSFRESGQIEQDLDVAMLMWLSDPDNYRSGRVLKIGKNKEGEKAKIELAFDGKTQRFSQAPGSSYNELRRMAREAKREEAAAAAEEAYAKAEREGKQMELPLGEVQPF